MKRFPLAEVGLRALRRGDIVCNLGSGKAYVIDAVHEREAAWVATAVNTIEVSSPSEWELVRYEGDEL